MTPGDWLVIFTLAVLVLVLCGVAEAHPRIHRWANRTCDRIAGLDR